MLEPGVLKEFECFSSYINKSEYFILLTLACETILNIQEYYFIRV